MKNIQMLLIMLFCFILSSCFAQKTKDNIVSNKTIILGKDTVNLKCDPPLIRTHKSASLVLVIKEDWSPEPPWKSITLENGTKVEIKIVLIDINDKKYSPSIIGSGGGGLIAKFRPELPRNIKIKNIQITTSQKLTIEKIIWHNWTPL